MHTVCHLGKCGWVAGSPPPHAAVVDVHPSYAGNVFIQAVIESTTVISLTLSTEAVLAVLGKWGCFVLPYKVIVHVCKCMSVISV